MRNRDAELSIIAAHIASHGVSKCPERDASLVPWIYSETPTPKGDGRAVKLFPNRATRRRGCRRAELDT